MASRDQIEKKLRVDPVFAVEINELRKEIGEQ
jgi:hypothetical protein